MDAQSYLDLNIFPRDNKIFSVFRLFKNVKTVGGRERLDEMMRSPSNDVSLLKLRRDSIEFFKQTNLKLDINHDQIDLILHYIKYDKGHLRNNPIDSLIAYCGNQLKPSQNYYVVQIGIKYLLDLLKYSDELITVFTNEDCPDYLKALGQRINTILENPDLKYALKLSSNEKIRYYQLSKLDSVIRRKNALLIIELLHVFYELDVFETLAKVSKDLNFCLPTYIDEEDINIQAKGLFHPGITNPVPNDLIIDQENNVIFLSGSNMAGKSSLLKSIGMAVYLSHIGFPVPAKQFNTIVFNGLITTINLADDVQNGLSHYFSEVMRIKLIASTLIETTKMFIILDELFKGTNAQDAYDASLKVISAMSTIQNSIFIVSSHITEIARELKSDNIHFRYLENLVVDNKLKFTYQLKEGVSTDRVGMFIIYEENILGLLSQAK